MPGLILRDSKELAPDVRDENRRVLTEYISENAERLQFEPVRVRDSQHQGFRDADKGDLKGVFYYRLRRNDELGYETDDLFVSVRQSWHLPLDPDRPKEEQFHAVGGAVLVFSADGSVRYAINKGFRDPLRLAATREAYPTLLALGFTTNDLVFHNLPALSFAAMHRSF